MTFSGVDQTSDIEADIDHSKAVTLSIFGLHPDSRRFLGAPVHVRLVLDSLLDSKLLNRHLRGELYPDCYSFSIRRDSFLVSKWDGRHDETK